VRFACGGPAAPVEELLGPLAQALEPRLARDALPARPSFWLVPGALEPAARARIERAADAVLEPAAHGLGRLSLPLAALEDLAAAGEPAARCLSAARRAATAPRGPARVMGILNVTPDSFSDGGEHLTPAQAIAHGLRLIEEGAELVDVGGEDRSTGKGLSGEPGLAPA